MNTNYTYCDKLSLREFRTPAESDCSGSPFVMGFTPPGLGQGR
jgi:hypothetical protein